MGSLDESRDYINEFSELLLDNLQNIWDNADEDGSGCLGMDEATPLKDAVFAEIEKDGGLKADLNMQDAESITEYSKEAVLLFMMQASSKMSDSEDLKVEEFIVGIANWIDWIRKG